MEKNIYQYFGYGVQEKIAKSHTAAVSYVYLPRVWAGRRIAIILLDEPAPPAAKKPLSDAPKMGGNEVK